MTTALTIASNRKNYQIEKRVALLILIVSLVIPLVQKIGFAAEYGTINGATVTWNPQSNNSSVTNYDQVIRVQDGAVDANGTRVSVPGQLLALLPLGSSIAGVKQANFETSSNWTSTSLLPSESYYVYAATSGASFLDYIISLDPPWADGYPSGTILFISGGKHYANATAPSIPSGALTAQLVYLGSFITYSNGGRVVGFNRTGEHVIFATAYVSGASVWQQSVTFNHNDTFPEMRQVTFPFKQVPRTAAALILDLAFVGNAPSESLQSGNTYYDSTAAVTPSQVLLLDAQFNGIFEQNGSCMATVTNVLGTPFLSWEGVSQQMVGVIAPIAQNSTSVHFGVCSWDSGAPNALVAWNLVATYTGYVEPVHNLTYTVP